MNYEDWEEGVPAVIKSDSLWKMNAYRLSLFLAEMGWYDVTRLAQERRTLGLSDQLYRALGSISANLAEGYSRGTGKDRAHFYEYALGSARESRDWYYKGRHILEEPVVQHRLDLLTQVIRLLLTMIPQQRQHLLREESSSYRTDSDVSISERELRALLKDVPLPKL
jgi:four helix bundle protein